VWHLLTSVSARSGQDGLAMAATRFLTTVARSVHHGLFKEPAVLQQVCESIVLPNLKVRVGGVGVGGVGGGVGRRWLLTTAH
jgi:exportin-2 (importin alpha re-exporter)